MCGPIEEWYQSISKIPRWPMSPKEKLFVGTRNGLRAANQGAHDQFT